MFKFDFALDDADLDDDLSSCLDSSLTVSPKVPSTTTSSTVNDHPFTETSINRLLERLPDVLSYSPIAVPVLESDDTSSVVEKIVRLARRDLYDARYQLIAQDGADNDTSGSQLEDTGEKAHAFVEAPSDLVPGVYEGGLKTWECSIDLAGYLAGLGYQANPRGKRIVEIGCGTAVPSMYILRQLFSSPVDEASETELHLQDYNISVIELVSFPNILLTWYTSPAAASFRASQPSPEEEEEGSTLSNGDPNVPGDLFVTPALKSAFLAALDAYKIRLRFSFGSWSTFPTAPYDIVLTSETIYRSESLTPLLALLKGAATSNHEDKDKIFLCLVAAKVLYFGVGGGVGEFVQRVKEEGGVLDTVWELDTGVGRRIMSVKWGQ